MSDAERRIGTREREAAVAALQEHRLAGRLESAEYEERSLQAKQAHTWGDLTALFADLPQPWPRPDDTARAASGPVAYSAGSGSRRVGVSGDDDRPGGLIPEPWGAWITSLSPFAALILFFATGHHWQWFLLVPIAGILAYGPGGHRRHRRR